MSHNALPLLTRKCVAWRVTRLEEDNGSPLRSKWTWCWWLLKLKFCWFASLFFFTQHHNSGFTTPHSSRISAIRKCMRKVRISFSCVGIPKFCYVKYHLLFNPFPFPFAVNSFSNGPFLLWWFMETSECKLKRVFIMLLYFLQLRQSLEVKKTSLILHKKNQLKENLSQVTIRVNMTTLFRENSLFLEERKH